MEAETGSHNNCNPSVNSLRNNKTPSFVFLHFCPEKGGCSGRDAVQTRTLLPFPTNANNHSFIVRQGYLTLWDIYSFICGKQIENQ